MQNEDLAVRFAAGADADEGNRGAGHDFCRDFFGDGLDEEHCGAGLFHGDRVGDDASGVVTRAAGRAIPACQRGALRKAADVCADGDSGASHCGNGVGEGGIDLELDDVGEAFGHEASGVADGVGDADLIAQEGQVAHDHGARRAALDRGGQGDGDLDGHVDGAGEAEHDFRRGIADQEHVHAGAFEKAREGGVVASKAGKGRCLSRHSTERAQRDGFGEFGDCVRLVREGMRTRRVGLSRQRRVGGRVRVRGAIGRLFGTSGFHEPSVSREVWNVSVVRCG